MLKRHLSLNQIAGRCLATDEFGSQLVKRATAACNVPICDLTPAQIGLLIRQDIGRKYIVPVAIELLTNNPFIEVEFFPGDLMKSLLELPADYWRQDQDSWLGLNDVLTQLDETIAELADARSNFRSFLT